MLEHVPEPERALAEIRRVVRPGGLVLLYPAWYTRPWFAQGYTVRPYSDFHLAGKLIKASIPLRDMRAIRAVYTFSWRLWRLLHHAVTKDRAVFRYRKLTPNYEYFWMPDSDAANSLDPFEAILWFTSRGDCCLNCASKIRQFLFRTGPVILKINK